MLQQSILFYTYGAFPLNFVHHMLYTCLIKLFPIIISILSSQVIIYTHYTYYKDKLFNFKPIPLLDYITGSFKCLFLPYANFPHKDNTYF